MRASELDEVHQREKINQQLQQIIDRHTEPWGIKVSNVEVKQIDLPQEMQGQWQGRLKRKGKKVESYFCRR
jgi:regulator of protease activity HflC (stomatin/prohibitin superfamily)